MLIVGKDEIDFDKKLQVVNIYYSRHDLWGILKNNVKTVNKDSGGIHICIRLK